MGGDLGELGDGPPKFEVGRQPMHPSPNISRSSVIGCVRKCELSKIGEAREWIFLNWGFSRQDIYDSSDSKDKQKLKRYGRWLKKFIRNFRIQNGIFFLKKVIEKVLVREIFVRPPNSAQYPFYV